MFFATCFGGGARMCAHTLAPDPAVQGTMGSIWEWNPTMDMQTESFNPSEYPSPCYTIHIKDLKNFGLVILMSPLSRANLLKRTWVGYLAMAINFNCINLVQINEKRYRKRF